jgi:hypothetical protein
VRRVLSTRWWKYTLCLALRHQGVPCAPHIPVSRPGEEAYTGVRQEGVGWETRRPLPLHHHHTIPTPIPNRGEGSIRHHNILLCVLRLRLFLDPMSAGISSSGAASYDLLLRRALKAKRRRTEVEGCSNAEAVSKLPPTPLPPDDALIFCMRPDMKRMKLSQGALSAPALDAAAVAGPSSSGLQLPLELAGQVMCTRIGRGGRLMLIRADPLTLDPLLPDDSVLPAAPQMPQAWAAALDMSIAPDCVDTVMLMMATQRAAA